MFVPTTLVEDSTTGVLLLANDVFTAAKLKFTTAKLMFALTKHMIVLTKGRKMSAKPGS